MLATLANAQARRRIQQALEGLSVDAEMRALEGVREHIAKVATEGTLEREIGEDEGLRQRLRAIRDDARTESARRELEELKRQYRPQALAETNAAAAAMPAGILERAVPVPVA
jgi:phage shock protein A